MAKHNLLGKEGEDAATNFLLKKGHEILVRNYRFKKAEVDIISKKNNTVVFTEVKLRSAKTFGLPEEFVRRKKKLLMKQAAEEFINQLGQETEIRFDIISILKNKNNFEIVHIEDAFFDEDEGKYN
jgi:putative endonuclease